MTDRLKGVVVTFEADIREDDAQAIINAIQLIKGVYSVSKSVRGHDDIMNRERVRMEYREKLWKVLHDNDGE